jgi:hypothetical protein
MLFRMPRWVLVVLFVISLVFVLAGIGMVVAGAEGGWPGLLFFGVCAAVFAAQLWPNLLLSQKPEPVDALLRRYPGPVELHVPQRKTLLILIGVIVFGGTCAYYLNKEKPEFLIAALLWFCVAALMLPIPFVLYQLIRGASLRLENDGFRIKQPWKWRFVYWKDVSEFGIGSTALIESHKNDWSTIVTFDDKNAVESKLSALNRSIVGRNSSLPDTYGLSAEDLQALMNGWRERALRSG